MIGTLLEVIDERRNAGRAEAIVDIDHRDVGRAGVQHPQKRRNASKGSAITDAGWHGHDRRVYQAAHNCGKRTLHTGAYLRFLAAVQLLPALESGGGNAGRRASRARGGDDAIPRHAWAIACGRPSGEVVTMSEPLERPSDKHKWMAWPIVRGVMTLGYAMNLGYRALRFSANVAIEDVMQGEADGRSAVAVAPASPRM